MAAVSVFVDDAILGRLPDVCVRTGGPADMIVRSTRPVGRGGFGAIWLLVLFGPPGWVALLVLSALLPGQEQVTVRLPYSSAAWDREQQAKNFRLALGGVGLAALATALLVRAGPFPLLWVVIGAGCLGSAAWLWVLASLRGTGVHLDGSRRWVTLSRVHPAFASAVEAQEALHPHV
jgi:hypothetical protein